MQPAAPELVFQEIVVQVFGEEFLGHLGRTCPLPRELPFHKIVDWDAAASRFQYDSDYAKRGPDWTTT